MSPHITRDEHIAMTSDIFILLLRIPKFEIPIITRESNSSDTYEYTLRIYLNTIYI